MNSFIHLLEVGEDLVYLEADAQNETKGTFLAGKPAQNIIQFFLHHSHDSWFKCISLIKLGFTVPRVI